MSIEHFTSFNTKNPEKVVTLYDRAKAAAERTRAAAQGTTAELKAQNRELAQRAKAIGDESKVLSRGLGRTAKLRRLGQENALSGRAGEDLDSGLTLDVFKRIGAARERFAKVANLFAGGASASALASNAFSTLAYGAGPLAFVVQAVQPLVAAGLAEMERRVQARIDSLEKLTRVRLEEAQRNSLAQRALDGRLSAKEQRDLVDQARAGVAAQRAADPLGPARARFGGPPSVPFLDRF